MNTINSMMPREHGAYGQLALPLFAALIGAGFSLSPWLIGLGAVAAFMAHEPLLVLTGARGSRAKREFAGQAKRALVIRGALALLMGLSGLALAARLTWFVAILPIVVSALLVPLIAVGKEKTLLGECIAAVALSGASVPVAVAGGAELPRALLAWGVWSLSFVLGTAAVRAVVAKQKAGVRPTSSALILLGGTVAIGAASAQVPLAFAAAPTLLAAWGLFSVCPHPRHLKRAGWSLVAASSATAVLVLAL